MKTCNNKDGNVLLFFLLSFSNWIVIFPLPNLMFLCQCCKQDWNSKVLYLRKCEKNKTWKQPLLFTTVQKILFKLRPRYELPHDKTNKITVRPATTQISPVWSGSLLSGQWVAKDPSFLQVDCERLWSDWADAEADLSLRWACSHFIGFVMRRLVWTTQYLPFLTDSWLWSFDSLQFLYISFGKFQNGRHTMFWRQG